MRQRFRGSTGARCRASDLVYLYSNVRLAKCTQSIHQEDKAQPWVVLAEEEEEEEGSEGGRRGRTPGKKGVMRVREEQTTNNAELEDCMHWSI